MKIAVAARERRDSLETPQTPWPLVQPFARPVPIPTASPATISSGTLVGDHSTSGRVVGGVLGLKLAMRLAAKRATLIKVFALLLFAVAAYTLYRSFGH